MISENRFNFNVVNIKNTFNKHMNWFIKCIFYICGVKIKYILF